MSSTVISIIRRIGKADGFDNITNYPDATLNEWIADARLDVPVSRLGANADRALAYYTAHLMLQGSTTVSSTGGGVKKQKTRNVEVEYQQVQLSSVISDKYYELYLQFIKRLARPSPMVLNGQ
jgi:hypothetical protein